MRPQQEATGDPTEFRGVQGNDWLGGRDSNPDTQIQSLQSYH